MRILILTANYLPEIGGISNHVSYLVRHLRKQGARVDLLHLMEWSSAQAYELEDLSNEDPSFYRLHLPESISLRNISRYRSVIFNILDTNFSDVKLVHLHDFRKTELLFFGSSLPWVLTNHSSFLHFILTGRGFRNFILSNILRFVYRRSSGIIGISHLVADQTKIWLGAEVPVNVIPNGIDVNRFESPKSHLDLSLPGEKISVLIPARWDRVKGIHLAIAAAEQLDDKSVFHFVFVGAAFGDVEYGRELRERGEYLSNVTIIDSVAFEYMPSVYRQADIVLLPSLFETGGIVPLEAMISSKPIVAANVGNIPLLVEDEVTGFLFEKNNVEALINALYKANKVAENYPGLLHRAKKAVEMYDWDSIASETVDFYREVLSG